VNLPEPVNVPGRSPLGRGHGSVHGRGSEATGRELHLAFVDSWVAAPERGTGTAVAISGLAAGLEAIGCRVTHVRPEGAGHPRLPERLRFNLALPGRIDLSAYDAVVGFDLDGFRLRPVPGDRYAVSLKGVAADERRYERGLSRATLSLLAALEGGNARRASRVLVPSEHSRRRAVEAYRLDPERVSVVPEGLDLGPWREGAEGRAGGAVILSVARQYRRKDTRTLLEAFSRVRGRHPAAALRIVGGGPELPALRARAAELGLGAAVTFLGELPDDEAVRREYLAADVFCLPSLQEGFGIVLLEAMAAGLPIVATRAAAIPEVVPDGEAGLLVPPSDPEALAEALDRLLSDPDLRRRLGEAGRRHVERFDWKIVAGEFLGALGLHL